MDWKYLKEEIYFSDGSLRDIYVLNTSREDWQKWIDFVNGNYEIEFHYCDHKGNRLTSKKIISKYVFNSWDRINDFTNDATISIEGVIVKCHFFGEEEIENDIDPNEVKTLEDHYLIINYLKSISKILNKEVILTLENYSVKPKGKLIVVDSDQVFMN
ncbi:hypothetical protein NZ698_00225 [Chryseobacterium sp. PBS4-4]|uniref:Uncharacterized protein n=1 Tax=Chryseobacterium edaphi TaxID=2976532 RepID=A0ABT2W4F2_9FLAO|nr:hypothetical protein [Chryseobacterium edaphi]MCU7615605.1 hypothetical protein [Chryseobacterium edaphi]